MSKLPADLSCVTMVSVDLAKHVFQVQAVDANGKVIVARGATASRRFALDLSVRAVCQATARLKRA